VSKSADVIIRDGLGIRDINTAAMLWCASSLADGPTETN